MERQPLIDTVGKVVIRKVIIVTVVTYADIAVSEMMYSVDSGGTLNADRIASAHVAGGVRGHGGEGIVINGIESYVWPKGNVGITAHRTCGSTAAENGRALIIRHLG